MSHNSEMDRLVPLDPQMEYSTLIINDRILDDP